MSAQGIPQALDAFDPKRWEKWSIDINQDPYDIPLDDLIPSHPDLFQAGKAHRYFQRLRRESPVHYSAQSPYGPYWNITKYAHIVEIERDFNTFSSEASLGGVALGGGKYESAEALPMFIAMDPPKHDAQRKVVQANLSSKHLTSIETVIRMRASSILDRLPRNETFNWVELVSKELTGQMLASLLGVPQEDRQQLLNWSDTAQQAITTEFSEPTTEALKVLWTCFAYFEEIRKERVTSPGDDLITMLAMSDATRQMPPSEFLGNVLLLIVGGNDTTRNSISGGVLALNEFPDQYAKLKADRRVIPGMIAEMIRYQTPVAHMARTATRDVEFHGKEINKGDRVALWYLSGNRDETAFEHPDRFVIDRAHVRRHLAFGSGIHRCVGNRLGELQLRILWEEIENRFKKVEVVGEPVRARSSFIHGIRDLPTRIVA